MKTRHYLVEDGADESTCKSPTFASLDEMIEVAFHRFENKIQLLGGRE